MITTQLLQTIAISVCSVNFNSVAKFKLIAKRSVKLNKVIFLYISLRTSKMLLKFHFLFCRGNKVFNNLIRKYYLDTNRRHYLAEL